MRLIPTQRGCHVAMLFRLLVVILAMTCVACGQPALAEDAPAAERQWTSRRRSIYAVAGDRPDTTQNAKLLVRELRGKPC